MAVSRRLRFEILRRDGHTCRYCGAKAPDVTLTVDHVVPVALGGTDEPENLVTACEDCNSGKTSISPDSPIVANVADDALRWAAAMEMAADVQRDRADQAGAYAIAFREAWMDWTYGDPPKAIPLPPGWEDSLARFYELGIDHETVATAIRKAMTKRSIRGEFGEFNYMCGVLWSIHEERQAIARGVIDGGDV